MAKKKERIYWDSDCFLSFFNREEERFKRCEYIVGKANNGEIEIIHSVITLIEVIKMKDRPYLKEEQEEEIKEFFDNDFLIAANVDEGIGTLARNLIWKHNTHWKDSIHVATAIYHDISVMNTFDKELLDINGQLELRNGGTLTISLPELPSKPKQRSFFNGEEI